MKLSIFEPPEKRRYWIIRAEGGRYYKNFLQHSVVALGHLDCLNLLNSNGCPPFPEPKDIQSMLEDAHKKDELPKRHTANHYSQVIHFINDISIGDWVLTVGQGVIRFGRVVGNPRLSTRPLRIIVDPEKQKYIDMPYHLRRSTKWGPSIPRDKLPYGLQLSLKSNQTLVNIDNHWEAIHHTLYPVFKSGKTLYLSTRINRKKDISAYYMSKFLVLLSEIEVISKCFNQDTNGFDFESEFFNFVENNQLTLTTKASFFSAGDIWSKIPFGGKTGISKKMINVLLIYSMLFGNQVLGIDGFIDLQSRQKLWSVVIERLEANSYDRVKEHLRVEAPQYNTKPLEDSKDDEKSNATQMELF